MDPGLESVPQLNYMMANGQQANQIPNMNNMMENNLGFPRNGPIIPEIPQVNLNMKKESKKNCYNFNVIF